MHYHLGPCFDHSLSSAKQGFLHNLPFSEFNIKRATLSLCSKPLSRANAAGLSGEQAQWSIKKIRHIRLMSRRPV
jgi:hypothetical protein